MPFKKPDSCKDCPRYKENFVPPDIVPGAKLMVVGEAPGEEENECGRVFVGKSGNVLNLLLSKSGSQRGLVSVVNAVACFVRGNPTPTVNEIRYCSSILETAIKRGSPRVVLAVGAIPSKRLVGNRSLSAWRGSIIEAPRKVSLGTETYLDVEDLIKSGKNKGKPRKKKREVIVEQQGGRTVIITNHPAELLYSGFSKWPLVQADFQRAVRLANGRSLVEVGGSIEVGCRDTEKLTRLLENCDELTVDIESSRETGKITMVGIAPDPDHATVWHPTKPVLSLIGRWLEDERNTIVGHNIGAFDLRKFREYGLVDNCAIWDTMIAAHYERPDILRAMKKEETDEEGSLGKSLALDMVCSRIATLHHYNWKQAFREGRDLDEWHYCALDVCHESFIKKELERRLDSTGQLPRFLKTLMSLVRVVGKMEDDGIRVDEEARGSLLKRATRLQETLREAWDRETGGVDPQSPVELRRLFYETLRLKPIINETTGKPTLDREALETLFERNPNIPALRILNQLRHISKMESTYLRREVDHAGHAHFTTQITGTVTGRFAGDGQQIPKHSKKGVCRAGIDGCVCNEIRRLYTHDHGDELLVVADYSQIEDRVIAILAGEEWLIKAFEDENFDHYQTVATEMSKMSGLLIDRPTAKVVVLGTNYAMGQRTLAKTIKCKESLAKTYLNLQKRLKPKIHAWRIKLLQFAEKHGFVANPFGRRLHFNGSAEMSKVAAFVPQSTAFDMIADAMLAVSNAGLKIRMQIHDELVISGQQSDLGVLAEAMEIPHSALGDWFCPVEVGAGKNWQEGKANGKRWKG